MKTANITEMVLSSTPIGRITFIDIGRTTIVYPLNNDIKGTINKTPFFPVQTLKSFEDHQLAKDTEIMKGLMRVICEITEDK